MERQTQTPAADRAAAIDQIRRRLEAEQDDLLASARTTVSGLIVPVESAPDPLDRAVADRDRGMIERIRSRESRLIAKIQAALERIEDGSYGICERCGEEIAAGRLMARPVAALCIACKSELERAERLAG